METATSLASKFVTEGPQEEGRARRGGGKFLFIPGREKDSSLFKIRAKLHSFHLKVVK